MSAPTAALTARRSRLWGSTLIRATIYTAFLGLWILISHHFGWSDGQYDAVGVLLWVFLAYLLAYRAGRRDANRDSDRVIKEFAKQAGVIR